MLAMPVRQQQRAADLDGAVGQRSGRKAAAAAQQGNPPPQRDLPQAVCSARACEQRRRPVSGVLRCIHGLQAAHRAGLPEPEVVPLQLHRQAAGCGRLLQLRCVLTRRRGGA